MKNGVWLVLVFLILLSAAACGPKPDTANPPPIAYGQDVCDRCNMIISEEKYAAAYWTAEGEARRFDDIGGMLAFRSEQPEEVASYWVHDYQTGEWVRAEEAAYLMGSDFMTPMGFGIIAFAGEGAARAMAGDSEQAMIYSFAELLAMDITMPANSHGMGEMGGAHDAGHAVEAEQGDGA